MDVGGIEPGADFGQQIDEAIGSCDVLLAVIGPQWATVTDAHGRRRLDDPGDFVALEIGTALRRPDVKVIPVLVDGARMPTPDELPPALATLGRRQAIDLSAARWRYDVDTLLVALQRALDPAPTGAPASEPPSVVEPAARDEPARPAKARTRLIWIGALAVVAVLGVSALLVSAHGGDGSRNASGSEPPQGTSVVVGNARPPKPGDTVVAAAQTTVEGNHYRIVLSTADDSGAKRERIPLYMNLYAGQPLKLLQRREMPYPWYRDSVVAELTIEPSPKPNPTKSAGVEFAWFRHPGEKRDLTHNFGVAYHGIDIY